MQGDSALDGPSIRADENSGASSTIILIRATTVDARLLEFADTLGAASGHDVVLVTDERRGPTPTCRYPIAGISNARCEALGLFCPPAFAWQCGDYGYYVARSLYPLATHFWLIEYDVRFSGNDVAGFFAFFAARPEIDFLASYLQPAGWDWYWAITARARDVQPTRCLFPVTRLSARAIDAVHAKRVAHGRRLLRRALWPNDEAMVATTLVKAKFTSCDLNDFGQSYYDEDTFSFTLPINGNAFHSTIDQTRIFHPVLFDEQYERKINRLKEGSSSRNTFREKTRRMVAKLNSWTLW